MRKNLITFNMSLKLKESVYTIHQYLKYAETEVKKLSINYEDIFKLFLVMNMINYQVTYFY